MHIRQKSAEIDPVTGISLAFDINRDVDELARPFMELAEKFEAARLNDVDQIDWISIADTNAMVWTFTANYLPSQLTKDTPEDVALLLVRIGAFMQQASKRIKIARDDTLIDQIVQLNVNMCQQLLGLRSLFPDGSVRHA